MTSGRMMKNNLILAASLAVLSTLALWYEYKQKPKLDKQEETSKRAVPGLEDKEVESVRFINEILQSDTMIACTKDCKGSSYSSEWSISKPVAFKADASTVSGAVTYISTAQPTERIEISGLDDAVLKNYALDAAQRNKRRIEVKVKGQTESFTIYIGEQSPVTSDCYALVTGPGIKVTAAYLVSNSINDYVTKKLNHWKSKRLLDLAATDVKTISLTGPSSAVLLTKGTDKESGNWLLGKNRQLADSESADAYLTSLIMMSVQDYVSDDKVKDRGKLDLPSQPKYRLTLGVDGKPGVTIDAYENSRKPAEYYVTLSTAPYIAKIDLSAFQKFQRDADSFRFKKLLTPAEKFNVQKLKLSLGKDVLNITQEKGAWLAAELKDLQGAKVDTALSMFGSLRVTKFITSAAVKGQLQGAYQLFDKDGKTMRSVSFYKAAPNSWFAKLSANEGAELDASSAAGLFLKKDDFLLTAKAPVKLPPPAGGIPTDESHKH